MKLPVIIILFLMISVSVNAQNLTASTPGRLQVYFMKKDGSQAMITSENLAIIYDNLKMTGSLMLNSFHTDDEQLKSLLDSAFTDEITFSGTIPEGQFVFQNMLDNRFVVETELIFGDIESKILIDYTVSNRNTSLANTFAITCSGSISLKDDLGITRETGLDDRVSFQFSQNVITRNY
jgi:hypothetical protein